MDNTITIKPIRNREQYSLVMDEINSLISNDPDPESASGQRLEVLSILAEKYETEKWPIDLPDPISAILFRMDQLDLKRRDLVPYLGTKSRVSEILSGKRALSLKMIKSLNTGLGIPAVTLLSDSGRNTDGGYDVSKYPLKEMFKRGWLDSAYEKGELIQDGFEKFFRLKNNVLQEALFRSSSSDNEGDLAKNSVDAWIAQVLNIASQIEVPAFNEGNFGEDFLNDVVGLSWSNFGPLLAQEMLLRNGIVLVILPHLPKTKIDGAVILFSPEKPIIALSLRYDRLDYFWFTIMHELSHLLLHRNLLENGIVDWDIESISNHEKGELETEANDFAQRLLIPNTFWNSVTCREIRSFPTPLEVVGFAEQCNRNPAIVAGRIRYEQKDYSLLSDLVGQNSVRKLFKV